MDYCKYINEIVISTIGRKGKIVDVYKPQINNNYYIRVEYIDSNEIAEYQPIAFENGFLKFEKPEIQKLVDGEIEQKRIEAEKNAIENAKQAELYRIGKQELELKEKIKLRQGKNENKRNIAYKATYCDGNGSWFRKPCSKKCIENNIRENRSWCSRSLCKDFLDGKATSSDINNKWATTQDLCYESRILEDFSVSAGLDEETNNPRKFVKLERERLVVLTTVEPKNRGNERIIFGAFLVERIISDEFGADKAISQEDYRIELNINEARKMKFWDYYENANNPDSEQWGSGLIRYLSDDLSAKILYDMVEIIKKRKNSTDTANATDFLNKYLRIIGRTVDEIK